MSFCQDTSKIFNLDCFVCFLDQGLEMLYSDPTGGFIDLFGETGILLFSQERSLWLNPEVKILY